MNTLLKEEAAATTLQNPFSIDPASQPRESSSSTPQILVLADDLTGACDSASGFLRSGHSARVWLTEDASLEAPETVWVRHTASRDLSPQAAARAVTSAAHKLPAAAGTLLFKKVDSAGRGNIAAELLAARDAYAADVILLAPSFPATGRIVRDGILRITDVAGQHATVSLTELFSASEHPHIGIVHTAAQIVQAFFVHKKILICDAETDHDLRAIAQAASALPWRILWAGSAGLANALALSNPARTPTKSQPYLPRTGSVLVCVGTSHNVTQLQLAHLLNAGTALLSPDHPQLDANTAGVLQITCKESDATDVHRFWQKLSPAPYALVLTGGDTAAFVLRVLAAEAIVLKGEVAPGVPWGIVEGGLAAQCVVVTKSGGFGDEACLTDIVAFLRGPHR